MEYAPAPWPSPRTGWCVLRWEFSNSGKPPKVRERSSKAAFHHILHIEGRHHLPGRCRAGPTTTSRAERSSACSSRPCVVVGAEPAVRRRGRRAGHASPGRPPRPTSPLRRRSPRRSRHSRRASACFRRSVLHRPSWTWLRAALHRPDDGAVTRPAAGCAAAVDSLAPDVAAASEGCAAPLLGLTPSTCGGGGCGVLPPRRLRGQRLTGWPQWRGSCTRSWPWGSPTLDASKTRMI